MVKISGWNKYLVYLSMLYSVSILTKKRICFKKAVESDSHKCMTFYPYTCYQVVLKIIFTYFKKS